MVWNLCDHFLESLNAAVDITLIGGGNGTVVVFFSLDVGVVPEVGGPFVVDVFQFVVFLPFISVLLSTSGCTCAPPSASPCSVSVRSECRTEESFCQLHSVPFSYVVVFNVLLHCQVYVTDRLHSLLYFLHKRALHKLTPNLVSLLINKRDSVFLIFFWHRRFF